LLEAYHESSEEQSEQPIGMGGLILQFSEDTLDPAYRRSILDHPEFECRMYVLAENMERSKEWENVFNYMVSLFDECREEAEIDSIGDDDDDDYDDDDDDYEEDYDQEYEVYGHEAEDVPEGDQAQDQDAYSHQKPHGKVYYSQQGFLTSHSSTLHTPSLQQQQQKQLQQCSIVPTKFLW
jgi:hypothetical protein